MKKKKLIRIVSSIMAVSMAAPAAVTLPAYAATETAGSSNKDITNFYDKTAVSLLNIIHGSTSVAKENEHDEYSGSAYVGAEKTIYGNNGHILVSYDSKTKKFSMKPVADDGYVFVGYEITDSELRADVLNENYIADLLRNRNTTSGKITITGLFEKKKDENVEKKPGYISFMNDYDLEGSVSKKYDQDTDTTTFGYRLLTTRQDTEKDLVVYDVDAGKCIDFETAKKNPDGHKIRVDIEDFVTVKENFDDIMRVMTEDPTKYGAISAETVSDAVYRFRLDHGWVKITWNGEEKADVFTVTATSNRYLTLEAEPDEGYEQTGTLAILGEKGADKLLLTEDIWMVAPPDGSDGVRNFFNKIKFTKKADASDQSGNTTDKTTDGKSDNKTDNQSGNIAAAKPDNTTDKQSVKETDTSNSNNSSSASGTAASSGTASSGNTEKTDNTKQNTSGTNTSKNQTLNAQKTAESIDISKLKYRIADKLNVKYTGKTVYPKVQLTVGGKKATIRLKTVGDAISIGSGKKLKIVGTGKYYGTITIPYNIVPADVKLSLTASGTAIKAKVSHLFGGTKPQVQCRTVSYAKGKKKYSKWKNLKSVSGFKAGQKVEVRARAVKGKMHGSWTAKTITMPKRNYSNIQ